MADAFSGQRRNNRIKVKIAEPTTTLPASDSLALKVKIVKSNTYG
jgi:hypothetical protein